MLIAGDQDVIAQVSRSRAASACSPRSRTTRRSWAWRRWAIAEFGLFAAVDHPLAGLEQVSERDLSG